MLSHDLLSLLRCPESGQILVPAPTSVIARMRADWEGGQLRNRVGEKVMDAIESGLVREDGRLLFPIRDEIPVLVLEEGIPL